MHTHELLREDAGIAELGVDCHYKSDCVGVVKYRLSETHVFEQCPRRSLRLRQQCNITSLVSLRVDRSDCGGQCASVFIEF